MQERTNHSLDLPVFGGGEAEKQARSYNGEPAHRSA